MCSNLLEKISKEERESESGGKEVLVTEGDVYDKITGIVMVVWVVMK